jgi:predicted nucleic acid-binding protein
MPETEVLVINTGPMLALIAGYGDLSLLEYVYKRVLVPLEVCQEIDAGGVSGFGIDEFRKASFIEKQSEPLNISTFLKNSLDSGEASVIQLALNENKQRCQTYTFDKMIFFSIPLALNKA